MTYICRTERVRLLKPLALRGNLMGPGEVLRVACVEAQSLILEGKAAYATGIRALRDGVFAGQSTLSRGQEAEVGEGQAVYLHNAGQAEILDLSALSPEARGALQDYFEAPAPEKPTLPLIGVVAKEDGVIVEGGKVLMRGEKGSHTEPEAILRILGGSLALDEGQSLTSRGKAYLQGLQRKKLGQEVNY